MTTFLQGATAWAGSDKALADDEVEQSKNVCAKGTAFDVPVYVSPIAVVFNLKGVSDQGKHVNMDASTIAKIFDGKITKWNDAAIKSQNPKLNLPDTDITVVHRSDKSGTTQNFVSYFKDDAPNDWTYDLSENCLLYTSVVAGDLGAEILGGGRISGGRDVVAAGGEGGQHGQAGNGGQRTNDEILVHYLLIPLSSIWTGAVEALVSRTLTSLGNPTSVPNQNR